MKFAKLVFFSLAIFSLAASSAFAAQHTFGLGAGSAPDYEGSDDYNGVPLLMLTGKYDSGRSFALLGTNLRVNLIASETFQFGPVLNYRSGRDDVDNSVIDRMADIDDAFEAGVYALADINNWLLGADFLADVSDTHDGMLAQGNVGYRWRHSKSLVLTPSAFLTYADGDYMATYFGVDSKNVGTSKLPNYSVGKGFKDYGAKVVAHYTPWQNWGVMGILSYSSLIDDAKDSPVVKEGDDAQMFFGLMGTYRWGAK